MSAFGPAPIPPNPNAVQASFIAQHAAGARPRDKAKTREADSPRRVTVQDEVRLSAALQRLTEEADNEAKRDVGFDENLATWLTAKAMSQRVLVDR